MALRPKFLRVIFLKALEAALALASKGVKRAISIVIVVSVTGSSGCDVIVHQSADPDNSVISLDPR